IVWRVLDHSDLLEDHVSLQVEIGLPDAGLEHQIADDIRRDLEMLIKDPGLVNGVLPRRIGVKRAAQTLERKRYILGAAASCPLEHHVLEEMGDTHPLAGFVE